MKNIPYDPLDKASLALWQQGERGDNRQQVQRLLTNLPLAVERELTPRQRQIVDMRFSRGMRVSEIADELGVSRSVVSRTVSRATDRLFRALRYSL